MLMRADAASRDLPADGAIRLIRVSRQNLT
jgi:hypothetical protein